MSYKQAFEAAGREYKPGKQSITTRTEETTKPARPADNLRSYEDPCEKWQDKAAAFVEKANKALKASPCRQAMLKKRGLDLACIDQFQLGWHEGEPGRGWACRKRAAWGLAPVKNEKTGRDKPLWLPRGLVIPCFKKGRVYRIRIRRPGEDLKNGILSKYYVVPGSGMDVMGFNPDRRVFVIVESELDAMMIVRLAGSMVGVVALGSAAAKPGPVIFSALDHSMKILVSLDYDEAGEKAWAWWKKNLSQAKLWPVPKGKDPGEAFELGVDIREWIRAGLPPALTMETSGGYKKPAGMNPMEELKMLLSRYPVTIEADKDHARINYDPGFKNTAIRQRINVLFYGNDELHWYLRMYHPDTIITGENCRVIKGEV